MYLSQLQLFHCGIFWIVAVQGCQVFYVRPPSSHLISMSNNQKLQSVSRFRIFWVFLLLSRLPAFSWPRCVTFLSCDPFLFERLWYLCFSSFECAIDFSLQHPCLLSVWYLLFYLQLSIGGRFGGRREYWLFCENFRELLKLYLITPQQTQT